MALDPVSIALGILELFRIAIIITIPVFLIAIAALFLRKTLSERFKLNWVKGTLLANYIVIAIIIAIAYILPYSLGFAESGLAKIEMPSVLAITPAEILLVTVLSIIKILISTLIITVLVLPLEFFGSFMLEKLKERQLPELAKLFITAFATCLLATIIILFVFPWIINGIIFLVYWG